MGYLPKELVGAVQQGDRKVIRLNDPAASIPSGKVALATCCRSTATISW
ncbi:hypothetical protein [Bradyrhizobium diazoefficiens]|nr:hypothetical protein [Bradyrhizobium diazoefficiens]WLA68070.1 hypothetical protein QNN01_16215 [Bradyrhizobium diazoefficiens]